MILSQEDDISTRTGTVPPCADNYNTNPSIIQLRERHLAIERKLKLVSRTAATLFDLSHNKRSLRVEWYIVILILVEILLMLYEIWHA